MSFRKLAIRRLAGALGLLLALSLVLVPGAPVLAVPQNAHVFYGTVTTGSGATGGGTVITASVGDMEFITTVDSEGKYGYSPAPAFKILADDPDTSEVEGAEAGDLIEFYIGSTKAQLYDVEAEESLDSYSFEIGGLTKLNLSIAGPLPGPGDGAAPPTYYTDTNLFGTEESFRISSLGKILSTIEAISADGNLTITIPKETIALDKDGKRLASLEMAVDETPPDPPEDAHIIGLAYDFTPDGATFDPAITLEYTYDPDTLPEDVAEEDLVVAYYDEDAGKWVEVDSVVDTENNTITASVAHFTTFAIIAVVPVVTPPALAAFSVSSLSVLPAEVEPGETVTIAVLVANTGGESGSYTVVLKIDGVKEAEKRVTVRAGLSKEVTFSVTREEADTYAVTVDGLSGSFAVVTVVVPPEPVAFSVAYLSFSPLEVEPGEAVTITVLVANIGGESGSYAVVLKIDGVKEAEETVTLAAGESQEVSFSATREEPGNYTVTVDGWSGSFTVVAPEEGEEEEEEVPAKPGVNWALIGGIIGGVIVAAGLLYYFLVFRRRAY